MNSDNEALVRRLTDEVINGGRLELVDELFSAELAGTVREAFTSFRNAFPDWREDIVDMVSDAERVAVRLRCAGTFRGEFMGSAPNGRRQEVAEAFFLRVHEGRIVDYWGLEDNLTRLRQLGIGP